MKIKFKKHLAILMTLAICLSMLCGLNFTASAADTTITFNLGANGSASHADGSSKTSYTETVSGYTLNITGGSQFYTGARDAKGNSAFKLGSSKNTGKFSMTVPADVTSVIFMVAQYKANTTKVSVGGQTYNITTASNNGAYTEIAVDTSVTKSLTFSTASGGVRCMINSISYVIPQAEEEGFTITATSNNTSYGTVEVNADKIFATPKEGYKVSGYEITSGNATVTQSGTTFVVETTEDVSITINFTALAKYTINFEENDIEYSQTVYENTAITLPYHRGAMDEGVGFGGWIANETTYNAGASYTVTENVDFVAKYTAVTGEHKATITFDNAVKRTEFSTSKQVWVENGVTVTNDKKSGSNIADYSNPARFYKSTALTISYPSKVSKIVVDANSESYATALQNSITDTNADVTVNKKAVTIVFATPVSTFNISSLGDQVRVDSITVYPAAAEPTGTITGAQVSVGADLSVKYFATVENATEASMKFTVENVDPVIVEGVLVDGKYEFVFPGIAPQRMGDNIKAELIANGKVIATKDDYSIKANAQNILNNDETTDKAKQFVTDMLYYGAAAQKYAGYKVNNLATDGIEGLGTPSNATPTATDLTLTQTTGSASFKSATVWFDSVNKLIVKINNAESATLKVNGVTVTVTDGVYTTEEIKVVDFDKVFTLELVENDQTVQTLTYSVNSYAYSKQNSTNSAMAELAIALYRLGAAAENI